jgi:hypothetical protein
MYTEIRIFISVLSYTFMLTFKRSLFRILIKERLKFSI